MSTVSGQKVSSSSDENVAALSTFFFSNLNMAPKSTSRSSTTKPPTNILVNVKASTKGRRSREVAPPSASESESDSDSDSESESESESEVEVVPVPEPPKKKKSKGKKPKEPEVVEPPKAKTKKVVAAVSESESEDDAIPLEETPKKKVAPVDVVPVVGTNDMLAKLGDGLWAIASQMAVANEANAKILSLLADIVTKMEERDETERVIHLLKIAQEVANNGKTLGDDVGELATFENFTKDEEEDEVETTIA